MTPRRLQPIRPLATGRIKAWGRALALAVGLSLLGLGMALAQGGPIAATDSILSSLEILDKAILHQIENEEAASARLVQLESTAQDVEVERRELDQTLSKRRNVIRRRLRALYKYSGRGFLSAVLSSTTGGAVEMLTRTRYLLFVVEHDLELLKKQKRDILTQRDLTEALATEETRVEEALRQAQSERESLEHERERRMILLDRVRKEERLQKRADAELALAEQRLEREVALLAKASPKTQPAVIYVPAPTPTAEPPKPAGDPHTPTSAALAEASPTPHRADTALSGDPEAHTVERPHASGQTPLPSKETQAPQPVASLASATPIPAKATRIPARATPMPAQTTPRLARATPIPAKATPIPARATPIPARATPIPARATPVPAKATPVPAKATPAPPRATPKPVPVASIPVTHGSPFEARKGRHIFPTTGQLTRTFGNYKDSGMLAPAFSKGIEIVAPTGTPFKAVAAGHVQMADWFKGYGLMVIINHGDEYRTIYAHASRLLVKVGDRVEAGDVIGLVGDTGSLKGPYLYLQIRRGKSPINPMEWLLIPPGVLRGE